MTAAATPMQVGEYLVNRHTNAMVEIMDIALSGNIRVLDIRADINDPWDQLTPTQIVAAWERINRNT